jgi:hypothetical protein
MATMDCPDALLLAGGRRVAGRWSAGRAGVSEQMQLCSLFKACARCQGPRRQILIAVGHGMAAARTAVGVCSAR